MKGEGRGEGGRGGGGKREGENWPPTEKTIFKNHSLIRVKHFSSEGHIGFIDDVSIIFIDKTDPKVLKVLTNRNTTGDIHLKQWNLKVR